MTTANFSGFHYPRLWLRFAQILLADSASPLAFLFVLTSALVSACTLANHTVKRAADHAPACLERVATAPRKSFMLYARDARNFAEVSAALSALGPRNWHLADSDELRAWLRADAGSHVAARACDRPQPGGLYWTAAPNRASDRFAWYVYWPTGKVVEYGDLYLPARLVLVRDDASAH